MRWSLQQALGAGAGTSKASFGIAVALQGDTAVVGASQQGIDPQGDAYVFTRSGATWTQAQALAPCVANVGSFGQSAAIDGDTILVGEDGAACVFVLANGAWSLQQALTSGSAGDGFGAAVALSGDTALVGALYGSGAAYVFVRASGAWTLQQQLPPPSGAPLGFGSSVAVEGDTAVVTSTDGASFFVRSGTVWIQSAQVVPAPPLVGFATVSLSGGTLAAGGFTGDGLSQIQVFAPDGAAPAFQQAISLGQSTVVGKVSVAMDGSTIVAGVSGREAAFVLSLESSDGEACTSPATCSSGLCVNGVCCAAPACPAEGPCNAAEHCQPGTGTCSVTPLHDGMPCPADACTHDATCQAGTCTGSVKVCPPADACHEFGACDPSSGRCSTPAKPDGTPCAGGTCVAGVCGGAKGPSAGGKGCACDAAGGAPAGGALISGIALVILRRRRLRARCGC